MQTKSFYSPFIPSLRFFKHHIRHFMICLPFFLISLTCPHPPKQATLNHLYFSEHTLAFQVFMYFLHYFICQKSPSPSLDIWLTLAHSLRFNLSTISYMKPSLNFRDLLSLPKMSSPKQRARSILCIPLTSEA